MVPTHFYNQMVKGNLFGLTEFIGGCGAGRFYMAIRADGQVDPCVFFPHTIGNIRVDDLNDLWLNDPLFRDLRNKDILKGNCGRCDYRYHCGGCRARAEGYFGDPLEADPGYVQSIATATKSLPDLRDRRRKGMRRNPSSSDLMALQPERGFERSSG